MSARPIRVSDISVASIKIPGVRISGIGYPKPSYPISVKNPGMRVSANQNQRSGADLGDSLDPSVQVSDITVSGIRVSGITVSGTKVSGIGFRVWTWALSEREANPGFGCHYLRYESLGYQMDCFCEGTLPPRPSYPKS